RMRLLSFRCSLASLPLVTIAFSARQLIRRPLQYVARWGGSCCGRALRNPSKSNAVAVLRFPQRREGVPAHPLSPSPLDHIGGVLALHPRCPPRAVRVDAARRHSLSSRPSLPPLAIGDRISLDRAYVDISAHLGGAVVEHGFDVKSTSRSIIDIH